MELLRFVFGGCIVSPLMLSPVPSRGQKLKPSIFPGENDAPFAYGGFYLRASAAAGGWIGSAEDLVRFATAIDGQRGRALLKPETVRTMLYTPIPSAASQTGLCWTVVPSATGVDFWHTGGLIGSNAAWLVRTSDGDNARVHVQFASI